MTSIAIIVHSGSGHTQAQAAAVLRGARSVPDVSASLITTSEVDGRWAELDDADAIVFGTPTYMGSASAEFKAFLDATSPRWQERRWADKLAAGFTTSAGANGDKLATLQQLAIFAAQHGMVWVGLGLLPGNITLGGSDEELNRLAGFLGAMAQAKADAPAELEPLATDLRTAEYLGRRVALAAARWSTGAGEAREFAEVAS